MRFVKHEKEAYHYIEIVPTFVFKSFFEENKKAILNGSKVNNQTLNYTGIKTINNGKEFGLYKRGNDILRVLLTDEIIQMTKESVDNSDIPKGKGIKILNPSVIEKSFLSFNDILFLKEKCGNIYTDGEISIDRSMINNSKLQELLKEFAILDKEIKDNNLLNKQLELVRFIYDYYKMKSKYLAYSSNAKRKDVISSYGVIGKNHTANCLGFSITLVQLYNHYGIKADFISTDPSKQIGDGHGMVKLYLDNGKVTYLDLAREISRYFFTSTATDNICKDINQYNFFLKSKNAFKNEINGSFPDFEENESIDIVDKRGNIINPIGPLVVIKKVNHIERTGFRVIGEGNHNGANKAKKR